MTSGLGHNHTIIKTQPISENDLLKVHRYTTDANIPRLTSDGKRIKFCHQQSTSSVTRSTMDDFFLRPTRGASKTLFLGTKLGEILRTMSFAKSVPKGLQLLECERGVGGKNSPIRYIPEKDPVQEALEKTKKTNYFKLHYRTWAAS